MVKLASLAPDIVAAVLDDDRPSEVTLFDSSEDVPLLWEEQRGALGRYLPDSGGSINYKFATRRFMRSIMQHTPMVSRSARLAMGARPANRHHC